MPTYDILNRTHSCYDQNVYEELCDIYAGGYQILKNAKRYLPKFVGENPSKYKERLEHASYIPYFGEIVDYFVSNLFNQDLTVTPPSDSENPETPGELPDQKYYSAFYRNADQIGTPFASIVKEAFREAIIYGKGVVCIDFPSKENTAETLAEEDLLGLSDAYMYYYETKDLRNWKKDDDGNYEWVVLKCVEDATKDPLSEIKYCKETFKVWRMGEDGFAHWTEYSIVYDERTPPQNKTDIPETDSGVTKFRNIPIVILEIPEGLWVGNKIGTLAREHFRRRSSLQSAESRSLFAVPVAALGPEVGAFGGALPSEAQTDPHRGDDPVRKFETQGYVVTGKDDLLYYMEPSGACYQIVDRELSELRDEMFRVVHQMAQGVTTSHGGALRRSGLSKIKDSEATVIILGEYGRLVRKFAEKIYKTISDARKEDVTWVGRGLDTFEVDARQEVIDEATKVDLINIPSQTFKTEYKTQLAYQILGNTHANIQQAIRDEIRDGVEDEMNIMDQLMKQGMLPNMPGGAPMQPPPSGPNKGGGNSNAQSASNIASGQVGKSYKPKQRSPRSVPGAGQPRDMFGRFGGK